MPTHIRAQCRFQYVDTDPKNIFTINPCFRHSLDFGTFDPQGLADDLRDIFKTTNVQGSTQPIQVRLYDIEGTKPVYPMAESSSNWGGTPASLAFPGELAVCLSFYHDHPRPRQRGRLYFPLSFLAVGSSAVASRVAPVTQDALAVYPGKFAALGGVDVDWIVWSQRDHAAHQVNHWFIDNEWDTVRSRGIKSNLRQSGTTSG
jgi:hypothetical protein